MKHNIYFLLMIISFYVVWILIKYKINNILFFNEKK